MITAVGMNQCDAYLDEPGGRPVMLDLQCEGDPPCCVRVVMFDQETGDVITRTEDGVMFIATRPATSDRVVVNVLPRRGDILWRA